MPNAVPETSAVTATEFTKGHHPNPPPDIIAETPEWAWSAPEEPASDSALRCHETQTELAHVNRVAILGQLSASIAHEINQPICAVVTNAEAGLRLLLAQPIDTEAVRRVLACILEDGMRTGDIVSRTRALIKKSPPRRECLEINAVIFKALEVTRDALAMNGMSVQTKLATNLPLIEGDRVQLQQVMLNLIINAVEAMSPHAARARDLLIRTAKTKSGGVLVAVHDSGPGVDPANLERIFYPYFTTKADGLGMGLSICRTIIQAHGGQLSATRRAARGTILEFTLPAGTDSASCVSARPRVTRLRDRP
jgi:C4-dicarboxylate-specific signal transduction histidine kinase